MKLNLENTIKLVQHKTPDSTFFDVILGNVDMLRKHSSIELSVYLYPYSRIISSKDFTFRPYEEYVNDAKAKSRSIYEEVIGYADKLFGIVLSFVTILIILIIDDDYVFSVEAFISILGAYAFGKEIWNDIDNFLIDVSRNWFVRWIPSRFFFVKQEFGTMQRFWEYARVKRSGQESFLPTKFDLISQSNSKTVEMLFRKKDMNKVKNNDAIIININVSDKYYVVKELNENGFMFGIKIVLIKKFLCFKKCTEIFQTLNRKEVGMVNKKGQWEGSKSLIRKTYMFGRLKQYKSETIADIGNVITN